MDESLQPCWTCKRCGAREPATAAEMRRAAEQAGTDMVRLILALVGGVAYPVKAHNCADGGWGMALMLPEGA